ncbi:MAG: EF-hand domain-containing protein [Sedimentitalea sp.]|nr:EF-hand domain-containing protein [Sedimentitalea sp.]
MTKNFFVPVLLAATLGGAALAQEGQPGTHFVENWDLDGDGQVSAAEATEKRDQLFSMFDQDSNNVLDQFEYGRFDDTRLADMTENAGGAGSGPMAAVNAGLTREFNDADGDGAVSRDEFAARSDDWFGTLDINKDGAVTTEDFGK